MAKLKDNAIADLRKLMGATDPAKAEEGTIRKKFAASIGENATRDVAQSEYSNLFVPSRSSMYM